MDFDLRGFVFAYFKVFFIVSVRGVVRFTC